MKRYEASIYAGDALIRIVAEPGKQIEFFTGVKITGEELSFAFIVKEAISCLASGKPLTLHFNPYEAESEEILYKCQWGRGGNLRVLDSNAKLKFMHANTAKEAFDRHRNFTCSKALFNKLPLRRFPTK